MYVVAEESWNNQTLVRVAIGIFDNNGSYGGYGTGSWSIGFRGAQRAASSVSYDFSGGGPGWIWSGDYWVDHDASGRAYVDGWASFSGESPVGSASASGGFWLSDYSRPPLAPGGAPSLSVTAGVVTVTSQAADGRGLAITDYTFRTSTDNANWSSETSLGTDQVGTFTASTRGITYYVQTRAFSSEGGGAWSSSGSIFVPAGGRRGNGSGYGPTTIAKRRDPSGSFVDLQVAKKYTGSAWVDLT